MLMILTLSFQLVPYLLDKTNFITLNSGHSWGEDGGAGLLPLHVANQPHQSPSRPCVTERNDVFGTGTVCSEESDLVT